VQPTERSSSPPRRLFRGGRPLKRWRYVGVFDDRLMACAAIVAIGPARQSFWALHFAGGALHERTRLLPRRRELQLLAGVPATGASVSPAAAPAPGALRLHDRGVALDLRLDEEDGIETVCANGREHVWTRKQAGVPARGTLAIGDEPAREVRARAVIDDTAGYHERHTEWSWTAGVGQSVDGRAVAWNLVSGVNDPPSGSERGVWIDGRPHEVGPVRFAEDLSRIVGDDGSELCFAARAERSHRTNLLIVRSDYRAPFGSFSGVLPGGVALASGLGVVEHHRALW
jgi:hypothetical protein